MSPKMGLPQVLNTRTRAKLLVNTLRAMDRLNGNVKTDSAAAPLQVTKRIGETGKSEGVGKHP